MRTLTSILIITILAGGSAFAQVKLPQSQLASQPSRSIQYQVETGSGFTEVKLPRAGEKLRKSTGKAFLMSLVLPGSGEHYVGTSVKSRIFMIAELGGWATLISFRHLGNWRKDDYQLLAKTEAGAVIEGKDDRYFDVLGFYGSREEYNKVAGVYDRDREYYPDSKEYFWKWSSDEARERYRNLKNDSKSYYRNANFALGFLIANHFLSALDAFWSARRHNRGIESGFSGIDLEMIGSDGWQLTLNARF